MVRDYYLKDHGRPIRMGPWQGGGASVSTVLFFLSWNDLRRENCHSLELQVYAILDMQLESVGNNFVLGPFWLKKMARETGPLPPPHYGLELNCIPELLKMLYPTTSMFSMEKCVWPGCSLKPCVVWPQFLWLEITSCNDLTHSTSNCCTSSQQLSMVLFVLQTNVSRNAEAIHAGVHKEVWARQV